MLEEYVKENYYAKFHDPSYHRYRGIHYCQKLTDEQTGKRTGAITSSPKGNDRLPDSKSLKYFEWCSSKGFFNWSRAANSKVHGWIQPNFKLIRDYIVVHVTCKNEEDPIKNEGSRVLTSL